MAKHHTKDKGDLAVLKVTADLCEQGFIVCTPHTEHAPFDLVAYRDGVFLKVQVKFTSMKNGSITASLQSSWADKHGNHVKKYSEGDFDFLAFYCPETKCCHYVPWNMCGTRCISLRVLQSKSKNKRNSLDAEKFRLIGPLAQRIEQSVSNREVESLNLSGASSSLFEM